MVMRLTAMMAVVEKLKLDAGFGRLVRFAGWGGAVTGSIMTEVGPAVERCRVACLTGVCRCNPDARVCAVIFGRCCSGNNRFALFALYDSFAMRAITYLMLEGTYCRYTVELHLPGSRCKLIHAQALSSDVTSC